MANTTNGNPAASEQERIGQTIRTLREAHGWRVSDFAIAIGVSQPYLSNMEAGRKRAPAHILRKVATVLNVPLAALVSASYPGITEAAA